MQVIPKKAYVIVHDGANVLIGTGGRSGRKRAKRGGYHLPGGTIDLKADANYQTAALRELQEETGIDAAVPKIEGVVDSPGAPDVVFVVARVADVNALVQGFARPVVKHQYDEPFEALLALPVDKCWENANFDAKFWTDWFKHGLFAAKDHLK